MHSLRATSVDIGRGIAVILMVIYHICYDLTYFKFIQFDFYHHPFWIYARLFIVSLFVLIAGISLHLATCDGLKVRALTRRFFILCASAALITGVSFMLFNKRFIFFGILHFMAVAGVLGLLFRQWFWLNLITGISLITIGITIQHPFFDRLKFIGLMTYTPATEDYVPLLPWFGVLLLGLFIGRYLSNHWYQRTKHHWRPIAWIGQRSLLIYMVHQPLLFGFFYLFLLLSS